GGSPRSPDPGTVGTALAARGHPVAPEIVARSETTCEARAGRQLRRGPRASSLSRRLRGPLGPGPARRSHRARTAAGTMPAESHLVGSRRLRQPAPVEGSVADELEERRSEEDPVAGGGGDRAVDAEDGDRDDLAGLGPLQLDAVRRVEPGDDRA